MKRLGLLFLTVFALLTSCVDNFQVGNVAERLQGTWRVEENSSELKSTDEFYSVTIEILAVDEERIFIEGFYNLGTQGVTAMVDDLTITIPLQTTEGGFEIYGSGIISDDFDEISWRYYVDDGSGTLNDEVDAIYTKISDEI